MTKSSRSDQPGQDTDILWALLVVIFMLAGVIITVKALTSERSVATNCATRYVLTDPLDAVLSMFERAGAEAPPELDAAWIIDDGQATLVALVGGETIAWTACFAADGMSASLTEVQP